MYEKLQGKNYFLLKSCCSRGDWDVEALFNYFIMLTVLLRSFVGF